MIHYHGLLGAAETLLPAGLAVTQPSDRSLRGAYWDHDRGRWVFAPEVVAAFLHDVEQPELRVTLSRRQARQTARSFGAELPDEEWFEERFERPAAAVDLPTALEFLAGEMDAVLAGVGPDGEIHVEHGPGLIQREDGLGRLYSSSLTAVCSPSGPGRPPGLVAAEIPEALAWRGWDASGAVQHGRGWQISAARGGFLVDVNVLRADGTVRVSGTTPAFREPR